MNATPITGRLSAKLDSMRKILAVMVAFGISIGLLFPLVAEPFVTWDPGRKIYFRLICLVAGFLVAGFCYLLVKITIYPKNLLLARQKAEWETTFNSLSEGIALIDENGALRRANRAFTAMVGLPEEDLRGRKLSAVMAERCGRQGRGCIVTKALYSGETHEGESSLNGKVCSQSAQPILDHEGKAVGCVFVLRDITERRRLRQELVQSARMAAVNHLVLGAAHEINNPLMGVTGIAELALSRDDIDARLRGDLELILREARRAADIVKQLLSYAATGKGGNVGEHDLHQLLHEAVELKEYNLAESGIELRTDFHEDGLRVLADPDQLKQVVFNIIDNAEWVLEQNPDERLLTISCEPGGETARVRFRDNGPGVSDEVRDHIFDPFFTTREVGQGAGLGLTMSFGIINDLGGRLWLEDSDGGGAHFVMELPLAGGGG